MKRLNNKGISIVEIIVAVSLVSVVMVFLMNILISVNNANSTSQSMSIDLLNQALVTREIQSDFNSFMVKSVQKIEGNRTDNKIKDIPSDVIPQSAKNIKGFIVDFYLTSDKGYILYYEYNPNVSISSNTAGNNLRVFGYKRGNNKIMRETDTSVDSPNFSSKNDKTGNFTLYNLSLPLYGKDGYDYGLDLSYILNKSGTS